MLDWQIEEGRSFPPSFIMFGITMYAVYNDQWKLTCMFPAIALALTKGFVHHLHTIDLHFKIKATTEPHLTLGMSIQCLVLWFLAS